MNDHMKRRKQHISEIDKRQDQKSEFVLWAVAFLKALAFMLVIVISLTAIFVPFALWGPFGALISMIILGVVILTTLIRYD